MVPCKMNRVIKSPALFLFNIFLMHVSMASHVRIRYCEQSPFFFLVYALWSLVSGQEWCFWCPFWFLLVVDPVPIHNLWNCLKVSYNICVFAQSSVEIIIARGIWKAFLCRAHIAWSIRESTGQILACPYFLTSIFAGLWHMSQWNRQSLILNSHAKDFASLNQ